jgi:hypothetical protein
VCTYLTLTTAVTGSAQGPSGWFDVADAVVSFDHPQEARVDHALCIDLRGANARAEPASHLTIELDAGSARALADSILRTLDDPEARALQ